MSKKSLGLVEHELAKQEKNLFAVKIIGSSVGYALLSLFLNNIRATAPIVILWILIIIQLALYVSIFVVSYRRVKGLGFSVVPGVFIFTVLAIIGRINDWEIVLIPITVVAMFVISYGTKKLSFHANALAMLIKSSDDDK